MPTLDSHVIHDQNVCQHVDKGIHSFCIEHLSDNLVPFSDGQVVSHRGIRDPTFQEYSPPMGTLLSEGLDHLLGEFRMSVVVAVISISVGNEFLWEIQLNRGGPQGVPAHSKAVIF